MKTPRHLCAILVVCLLLQLELHNGCGCMDLPLTLVDQWTEKQK